MTTGPVGGPAGVSRRALFRGAAALSGLALLGGCATRDEVWVAVPWSGWELTRFRAVLADFERDTGLVGRVVPLGDDIGAVVRELVRWGVTPLTLGAADGWVLTDFFENVLLSTSPTTYRDLARGADLWQDTNTRSALIDIGQVWAEPGALAGGASRELLTQFEESVLDLVHGRAAMLVAPDFAYPVIRRYLPSGQEFGERIDVFRFPPVTVGQPPLVTGGDVLVLPKPGSEAGRRLVTWLARPGAAAQWIRHGGFIPPQRDELSGAQPAEIPRRLAQEWQEATSSQGQGLYFDLSDELGALGGGDGQGLWTVLQDFLAEIGGYPGRVRSAAEDAARRMSDLWARTKGAWDDPPR